MSTGPPPPSSLPPSPFLLPLSPSPPSPYTFTRRCHLFTQSSCQHCPLTPLLQHHDPECPWPSPLDRPSGVSPGLPVSWAHQTTAGPCRTERSGPCTPAAQVGVLSLHTPTLTITPGLGPIPHPSHPPAGPTLHIARSPMHLLPCLAQLVPPCKWGDGLCWVVPAQVRPESRRPLRTSPTHLPATSPRKA